MTQDSSTTVDGSATPARPPAPRPIVGNSTDEWLARISGQLDELLAQGRAETPTPDRSDPPTNPAAGPAPAKKSSSPRRRAGVTGQ